MPSTNIRDPPTASLLSSSSDAQGSSVHGALSVGMGRGRTLPVSSPAEVWVSVQVDPLAFPPPSPVSALRVHTPSASHQCIKLESAFPHRAQ